ncbi:MAG: hypothetical protein U5L09_16890 [Bacteroidales bacterium]|nr:hypothetical protein [Bacteroidales bacterium]
MKPVFRFFEEATEVYYYIHAADESGRSENHPYIGAYDPHDFYPTPTNVAEIQLDAETLEATAMVDLTAEESLQISNEGEVDLNFTIDFTFNEGDGWAGCAHANRRGEPWKFG